MLDYIKLLRPKHWIKNVFVLAPLLFSEKLADIDSIKLNLICFIAFSLTSSSIYILNDIFDYKEDAKHFRKKTRPIASGNISIVSAYIWMFCVAFVAGYTTYMIPDIAYIIGLYVIINIAYNLGLKNIPVVDLFVIAGGFILRTMAGAFAINVSNSNWMLITVFCLSLFLITIKRRSELVLVGTKFRKSIENYTLEFLDKMISITATSTFVFYTMYVAINKKILAPTIPLVLFCIIRYMYLIQDKKGEDPSSDLFTDKFILLSGFLWLLFTTYSLIL